MDNLKNLLAKSSNMILHIIVTAVLCFVSSNLLGANSNYSLFASVAVFCLIVFLIGRMIFKKKHTDSLLKIICGISLLIFINDLYDGRILTADSPWIHGISQGVLFLLVITVFIATGIIFLLIRYIHISSEQPQNHNSQTSQSAPKQQVQPFSKRYSPSLQNKNLFPIFRVLGVVVLITAIVMSALWAFSRLNFPMSAEAGKVADLSALVSYLLGFGASILFIIFALAIIVLALIELARFLYSRLALFRNERKNGKSETFTLTYVFSFLIVFAMLLLTYKISDFTFDKFTEIAWGGDYLAVPLVLLVGIVAIVLMIRLTHGVLSIIMKPDPFDVESALKELKIGSNIHGISVSIAKIFFRTIQSALDFVFFIPNFFETMSKLVLSDDEDEDDDDV